MGWTRALFFAGGMVAAGALKLASQSKTLRKAAVNATAIALDANDAIQEATQNLMDDADDLRAEAERQRKIDAAVAERMAEIEEGVREEVVAEVDGKPAKKPAARQSRAKK